MHLPVVSGCVTSQTLVHDGLQHTATYCSTLRQLLRTIYQAGGIHVSEGGKQKTHAELTGRSHAANGVQMPHAGGLDGMQCGCVLLHAQCRRPAHQRPP